VGVPPSSALSRQRSTGKAHAPDARMYIMIDDVCAVKAVACAVGLPMTDGESRRSCSVPQHEHVDYDLPDDVLSTIAIAISPDGYVYVDFRFGSRASQAAVQRDGRNNAWRPHSESVQLCNEEADSGV
jgi:hypothetical protein